MTILNLFLSLMTFAGIVCTSFDALIGGTILFAVFATSIILKFKRIIDNYAEITFIVVSIFVIIFGIIFTIMGGQLKEDKSMLFPLIIVIFFYLLSFTKLENKIPDKLVYFMYFICPILYFLTFKSRTTHIEKIFSFLFLLISLGMVFYLNKKYSSKIPEEEK